MGYWSIQRVRVPEHSTEFSLGIAGIFHSCLVITIPQVWKYLVCLCVQHLKVRLRPIYFMICNLQAHGPRNKFS